MGLDCTAYERVELVRACTHRDLSESDWDQIYGTDQVMLWNLPVFEERGDGLVTGIYQTSGEVMTYHNTYGGYNRLREDISAVALGAEPHDVWDDEDLYKDQPMFRWVCFADNEGFLGPKTCALLAAQAAEITLAPENFWVYHWENWQQMFLLAAHNGVITYH